MKIKNVFLHCLLLFFFGLQGDANSQVAIDPRTKILTKKQWLQEVSKIKINSPTNALLLGQAANSKLAYLAFSHYGAIKQRLPQDPYAALYYGQSGRFYFKELLFLPTDPSGKRQKAIRVADENLAFAVKNLPESSYAHMAYGYFLWQFYSQMDRGLSMLHKAEQLDPKAANVRSVLGLMYSNSHGNCYDLEQAEKYYRSAVQLDPKLASARYGLSRVLKERGKINESNDQLSVALSLSPTKGKQ